MDTNIEDKRCEFGKAIDIRLAALGLPQKWLIEQVAAKTGLYFDDSYIYKVRMGTARSQKIVAAIREILEIPEDIG